MPKVFLSLGGNVGSSIEILQDALNLLFLLDKVQHLQISQFYKTTPVSNIPQNDFINAVCSFETTLSPIELLQALQCIEKNLGKVEKPKNAPRLIDIDILFYGQCIINEKQLKIPHPKWKERLFVLTPLKDLTSKVQVENKQYNIDEMIKVFPNIHNETVSLLLSEQ